MKIYKLQKRPKISPKSAKDMVILIIKYGNHSQYNSLGSRPILDGTVKRVLAFRGVSLERLFERCRDPKNAIPEFENLISSKWMASSGLKVERIYKDSKGTEHIMSSFDGPGQFSDNSYWSLFEEAVASLEECINSVNFSKFQNALTQGMGSIEAYIFHRAAYWNIENPDRQLQDSKANKVSIDDKFDEWIPIMTNGKKLDKSRYWGRYLQLRALRDTIVAHPQGISQGFSYYELCRLINEFR